MTLVSSPRSGHCRLCGKDVFQCKGFLKRVNPKGVEGIWECRPSCTAQLSEDEALVMALEDDGDVSVQH